MQSINIVMATNDYFQRGRGIGRDSEQNLAENLIIESIKIAGQDFYYVQRTAVQFDPLFNENPLGYFQNYGIVEMYINNAMEFGGQGHILSKFGLDTRDTMELLVSKKRFFEELNFSVPKEGDLIYWPLGRMILQIDFVKDESVLYSLSNLYTFSLKCSKFIYSYETFETGVPHIDELNNIGNFDSNSYSSGTNIPFAENNAIKTEANGDLDFTEGNPFGLVAEDE